MPRARAFTGQVALGGGHSLHDLELVVTELVTNAVLHGAPPITLHLWQEGDRHRVEVADTGDQMPVTTLAGSETMTGRGLGLVAGVAGRWGVEPRPGGGKVVWADLEAAPAGGNERPRPDSPEAETSPPPEPVEAAGRATHAGLAPSSATQAGAGGPLFIVHLGGIPTGLLVEAKAHIDSLVRELTLARAEGETGAPAGSPAATPAPALIDTVTTTFAEVRQEMKRQALAAAHRGEEQTQLVLHLPASAVGAAEAYRDALEEIDRYARAACLLNLETPPSHRVLRRWYLNSLIDQLEAQARGEPAPQTPSLVDALAGEVSALATFRDAWNRLQLLQKVTGELTGALSVEDAAATVAANAVEFLGALVVRVHLLDDDGVLRVVAAHGGVSDVLERYRQFSVEDDLPASEVVRTGEALILRNRAEIEARFPPLAGALQVERVLHVVPLRVGERPLGCLVLTFPAGIDIGEAEQVSFITALADALAQALQRAVAMQRAAEANERLAFLADASVALSTSLDYAATAEAIARLVVPRLADWCIVQVLESDRLKPIAVHHVDPAKVDWAMEMGRRYATAIDAPAGSGNVIRTGRSELHADVPAEVVERLATSPEHLAALREVGIRSGLVVPLRGRRGVFGAITLIYSESDRRFGPADVAYVEDVARRAALALETADTFEKQSVRLANVTSVAHAAQQAILAAPPPRVGPVVLAARYLSAAAEAQVGGDLYETVARPGAVRLLMGDVRGKGLSAVRLATVVLGEFRAAASDLDDLAEVAVQLDRRLRAYLDEEDFVTALLAEIDDSGGFSIASCGHPSPLVASAGGVAEFDVAHGVPLGLGAAPSVARGRLHPGDRILLYTDGIIEARDGEARFVDLREVAAPMGDAPFDAVLDRMLAALQDRTGPDLGDDLALVLAEYRPS